MRGGEGAARAGPHALAHVHQAVVLHCCVQQTPYGHLTRGHPRRQECASVYVRNRVRGAPLPCRAGSQVVCDCPSLSCSSSRPMAT